MRHAVLCCSLLPLLVSPGDAASGQAGAPEARAEIVRLDVVVTDADGKLVRDLRREDFQILEDGKPQPITQFLVVSRPGSAAPVAAPAVAEVPSTAKPAAPAEPVGPAPSESPVGPGRYVAIFVDDLHIAPANLNRTKEALHRFVAEFLGPDDRIAIVTSSGPGGVRHLTQDRAALGAAIDGLAVRQANVAPARGSQMTPAQAELILRGDPNALQLATRLMRDEPGSVLSGQSGPQAAVEAAGGFNPASVIDEKDRAAAKEVQRQARAILAEDLRFSEITLTQVDDVLRSLASLPGRKICLLVSDGFLVGMGTSDEQTRHLRRVIDAATRSGAVVYALDAGGLTTTGGDASAAGAPVPAGLRERVDRLAAQEFRETLSGLANDTGGFLVRGTNELAAGLKRMLDDNDAYYLMAYEPANTKRDGKFRKIEVRLPRRSGLVVRTRRGYLAPDDRKRDGPERAALRPTAGAAVAPVIDEADARAALASPIPPNGVPVRLVVDYLDLPPAGSQVIVRAHVNLAGLSWRQAEGRRQVDLELLGGVFDANGGPVGAPFGKRVQLDLTPDEHERALKAGLQYQNRMVLGPGRFEVRLMAREPAQALLGGAVQSVEIPDLGAGKLTLSSVFLSTSAATAGPPGSGDTEALRDVQTLRRFKQGESLYFQLYVYNATAGGEGASDVVLQAQILSGSKPIAASQPQPVTLERKDGMPLPQSSMMSLEGLAPGRYQLRIVVADRKTNTTVHRDVDFTVE
jgi:VWFA-related protein